MIILGILCLLIDKTKMQYQTSIHVVQCTDQMQNAIDCTTGVGGNIIHQNFI